MAQNDDDPSRVYAVADEVPCDVGYLTAGKRYKVLSEEGPGFEIRQDTGIHAYCLWAHCAHLDGGDWRRIGPSRDSTEPSSEDTP